MSKLITQDKIDFTNVKTTDDEGIIKLSAGIKVSGVDGVDPNLGGIINAVDIDWNGAYFTVDDVSLYPDEWKPEHYTNTNQLIINTSGQLLSLLQTEFDRINSRQEAIETLLSYLVDNSNDNNVVEEAI